MLVVRLNSLYQTSRETTPVTLLASIIRHWSWLVKKLSGKETVCEVSTFKTWHVSEV